MEKKAMKNVLASITGRTDSQSQTEGDVTKRYTPTGQESVAEDGVQNLDTIDAQEAKKGGDVVKTDTPTEQEPVVEETETFSTRKEQEELLQSIQDEELREKLKERRNKLRRGRPRKDEASKATPKDLYTRFCALVRRDQIAKIREICFKETLTIKEVIDAIFEEAIVTYEEKYGEINIHPHHGGASDLFRKSQ